MNQQVSPASIGHNQPPPITAVLSENQAALLVAVDELANLAGQAPTEIKSEIDLDTVGKVVTAAGKLAKRADDARVQEKEPYLAGGREVDAFFKTPLDRLDRIKKVMTDRASIYQRKVAQQKRDEAEAQAKRLREEAEARDKAADAALDQGLTANAGIHADQAKHARQHAAEAQATAVAPVAELARTTTQSGLTAGAKSSWVFEVTDWNAIPIEELRPYLDQAAIEKAIKAAVKIGKRELAGVRIFQQETATFRR